MFALAAAALAPLTTDHRLPTTKTDDKFPISLYTINKNEGWESYGSYCILRPAGHGEE